MLLPRLPQRPRGRAIAAAALALLLAGCQVELQGGLSQSDANEIAATLLEGGVAATREKGPDGAFSVMVAEEDFARAWKVLKANGLPRETYATLGALFQNNDMVATPTEQRARLVYGLGQELSRTVSEITGVVSARVHVVLSTRDRLERETEPATASVMIRHDDRFDAARASPLIRQLIASSVESLDYENVTIALFPTAPRPRAVAPSTPQDAAPSEDAPTSEEAPSAAAADAAPMAARPESAGAMLAATSADAAPSWWRRPALAAAAAAAAFALWLGGLYAVAWFGGPRGGRT